MNKNKNNTKKDVQMKKVQLTINNPLDFDMSHDTISKLLKELKSLNYYIMGDEIGGKDGTYHTHVYAVFSAPVRFSTLRKRFTSAHIEKAISTHSSNIAYVEKSGKWAHSEKGLTTVPNTLEEYGTRPTDSNGSNALLCELYELIKDGKSNFEILEANADLIKYFDKFDRIRLTLNTEKYKKCWRDLEVTYIWGKTGAGKSRHVMETYGYENVFRVTDYTHAWDTYEGQDVVVLEEYSSSFQIQKLLNYLDGYPLKLEARYSDKTACYTKLYIISNISLEEQYPNIRDEQREVWKAFLRRISKVMYFKDSSNIIHYDSVEQYLHRDGATDQPIIKMDF